MKYLVTAAMALALTGAAASALADTPPDHHKDEHKSSEHAPATRSGPPKASHDVTAPADRTERFRKDQQRVDNKSNAVHKEQLRVDNKSNAVHKEQLRVDKEAARVHNEQAGVDRDHAEFRGHALRPSDKGRSYYNAGAFRQVYRSTRRFHVAARAHPGGWYARTWSYGDRLPGGWFAPAYYLSWGDYGLPMPPIGCEWVREGADAVLVDVWSGEVLSVDRGVFY